MILTNTNLSIFSRRNNEPPVPAAPVNVVLPSLTGTGEVGTVVTCNKGVWTGVPTPTYNYDFKVDGISVQISTDNTYTVNVSDDGKIITCEVTATNTQGSASATTSNSITAGTRPVNTVAPTVSPSGTQSTGTVITVNVGTWTGSPTITYEYRWTRNGSPISGAINTTYTIQAADDGTTIRCEVRGTNVYGVSSYVASSNSVSAVNAIAPVNTVAPVISGTAVVGQTLSSTTGTWTGTPTPTYSYQWFRGATPIGTNSSTYTLVQADAGNTSNITCRVTATNTAGSVSADSNTIARILDTLTNNYITGLTLTSAEIDSFNTLYIAIRNNNYHTIIDNMMIYATATNAAALKPLFGSNTVTPVNSPTWTRKVGYTHTGTSYINRGTSSNVNFTRNDHTYMVGVSNKNTSTQASCGGLTASAAPFYITFTSTASVHMMSLAAAQDNSIFARTISNRDYAIRRQSSTQYFGFQDGVSSSAITRSTSNVPPVLLFDGAYNNSGSASSIFESGAISTYSLQGSSAIDPSIMRTIINNFINSL